MKRIITLLTLAVFILSCGGNAGKNELEKKKKDLIKKKEELVKLQKEIADLEAYVAKNDTAVKTSKKKLVNMVELKAQPFEHYIDIQGTIDSDENAFVSPANPGLITRINVKEGDRVGRGTVMASTESSALQSSLVEVQAALDLATIAYE